MQDTPQVPLVLEDMLTGFIFWGGGVRGVRCDAPICSVPAACSWQAVHDAPRTPSAPHLPHLSSLHLQRTSTQACALQTRSFLLQVQVTHPFFQKPLMEPK